jgi:hypothetical protein
LTIRTQHTVAKVLFSIGKTSLDLLCRQENNRLVFTMSFLARFLFLSLLAVAVNCTDSSYYNKFTVCANSKVVVTEMSIVCDSPGAYYYGGSKYRNSATCQAGDKARVEIVLQITQDLSSDYLPYLVVDVYGYGSVATHRLFNAVKFCNSVTAMSGKACPYAGYYKISEVFYWGGKSDTYDYSFTPKISVGVATAQGLKYGKYDLGGANTQKCSSGSTFTNWTTGVSKANANAFVTFLVTFGLLTASCLSVALAGWAIQRKMTENSVKEDVVLVEDEYVQENDGLYALIMRTLHGIGKPKEVEVVEDDYVNVPEGFFVEGSDDENSFHKMSLVGKNRDLVDF